MFRFSGPGLSEDYNDAMDEREKLMTLKAGNTVESMKPKEVGASSLTEDLLKCAEPLVEWSKQKMAEEAAQPSLICPDIDECAPVINAGQDLEKFAEDVPDNIGQALEEKFKSARAAQIPEEIPPTNLWSLRWRINELEKRVDELTDRIALFNVRSSFKI